MDCGEPEGREPSEPRDYTADGAWSGLCAAILERAILDACGDLRMRPVSRWMGHVYMATPYPAPVFYKVRYLEGCNGDLIQRELASFFCSRYARLVADGAGLNVDPAHLWYKLRRNRNYRKRVYRAIFPRGNRSAGL